MLFPGQCSEDKKDGHGCKENLILKCFFINLKHDEIIINWKLFKKNLHCLSPENYTKKQSGL